MDRTARQLEGVQKWITNNCIGCFNFPTGSGKTYTAILAIKKVEPKSIIVVVPTIILKDQWINELIKNNIVNYQVLVINTASKKELDCDLLIVDEWHISAANTFREIYEGIVYDKLLTLTATVERLDGEEDFLLDICPIVDVITLKECLDNKWISSYQVYNLAVPFSESEQLLYNKANSAFRYYAMLLGGNSFDTAKQWLANGTKEQKGQASAYYNAMRNRKKCITDNSNKAKITINIVNRFSSSYGIIFSESISFANEVSNALCNCCVSIHSKMTKKNRELSLQLFKDDNNEITWLSTVKSMNTGIDLPKLEVGVIASFNSSKLLDIQSLGRLLRINGNKQAKIINLYTPETQEKNWLSKKQYGMNNIKWINDVKEII